MLSLGSHLCQREVRLGHVAGDCRDTGPSVRVVLISHTAQRVNTEDYRDPALIKAVCIFSRKSKHCNFLGTVDLGESPPLPWREF